MHLFFFLAACASMKEKAIEDAMDRIWNQGDLSVVDQAYTPELAAEVKRFVIENRALYPDIRVTIDEVIVQGPWFVTRWTVSGTHRDLGKPVRLDGVSMRRMEGGVFVEETMVYDMKSVYDQLGFRVLPPAGASPFDPPATGGKRATGPGGGSMIDTSLFVQPSGKAVRKEAVIPAPRAEVFRSWTTVEGWKKSLDVEARIELRVGGPYEVLFAAAGERAEGERGSEGCQVLAYVPDEMLAFTWNAPPDFPDERGRHTWVVVRFDEVLGGATRVTIQHVGFGEGGQWDEVHAYFDRAWGKVLEAQQAALAAPK